MKTKFLPLLFILLTFIASCKKSYQSPLIGTWQQVKLHLYQLNGTGAIVYDTTYTKPFTSLDYIKFSSNGTCKSSTDHYYYPNLPTYPKDPQQVTPVSTVLNYAASGNKYVLTQQVGLINPGGFVTRDTISFADAHTLLWHSEFSAHTVNLTVSDAYYTK